MLKSMNQSDYYTFRIPYWDWRQEMQTDANSPFQLDRLGETMNINNMPIVQGGENFPSSWNTVCWNQNQNICDPRTKTGQLRRCPFTDEPCSSRNPLWPSDKDVQKALSLKSYDTSPFRNISINSFRNLLEGFQQLSSDSIQSCRDDKLCSCSVDRTCNGLQPGDPIQRLLHNSVSINFIIIATIIIQHANKIIMMITDLFFRFILSLELDTSVQLQTYQIQTRKVLWLILLHQQMIPSS